VEAENKRQKIKLLVSLEGVEFSLYDVVSYVMARTSYILYNLS